MNYAKPQLTLVGNAMALVRNHQVKNIKTCLDADNSGNKNATCTAYEADE